MYVCMLSEIKEQYMKREGVDLLAELICKADAGAQSLTKVTSLMQTPQNIA